MLLFFSISSSAQVAVIANKSVSDNAVSLASAGNIYSLNQTSWNDGTKIIVFDNSSESKTFYDALGKDFMSLKKEWMKKQLTGAAKAPQTLASDSDVIKKVADTPGAIGFVKASSVDGSVKVLLQVK
jgi:ABC-type phosphate transport system substrate-binding protein